MNTKRIYNRYDIHERLGAGGMGAVYRAKDRLTGEWVALKQVSIPTQHIGFASRPSTNNQEALRLALAREFQTLASLRHPHIISVLDYGFDDEQFPFFTMNLLQNPQNILEYGGKFDLIQKAQLLIQILQALTYLHRRGILHRDIKPANVLVTTDGAVKVLDFGLSATAEQVHGVAGTLTYMAPEVLRQQAISPASDLYSVGMIAYELFVGQYPFNTQNPNRLMTNILTVTPDTSMLNHPKLEAVLHQWLLKEHEERYQTAEKIISELCRALDIFVPDESIAIRESFLQSAQFIGREAELAQLQNAFEQAKIGHGGLWLVGGESGVGKSRLVDELRIIALTQGVTVLHGQSVETGALPYQMWRDVLPKLILKMPLEPQEASILKEIVPHLEQILGNPVSDAPSVDATARKMRLQVTINHLFSRQTNPILLILDDLQWAGTSLDLLNGFAGLLEKLPILIIGTYRDDERPQLPHELNTQNVIHLTRFDNAQIQALSTAMLGEAGKKADVVSFLSQETEGNIFFLIEVVRALAEEAGNLSLIGDKTLPEKVFTGGIQTIVSRRLSKLPPALAVITQFAAVIGREIDFDLLLHDYKADGLNDWLIASADAMIIEIRDNKWRFAHDKLREGALRDIPNSLRKKLNKDVAKAIEAVYPNNPDYNRALLEHWYVAGSVKQIVHYTIKVANYDLNVIGAHQRVHILLDRTLDLLYEKENWRMTLYNLRAKAFGLASEYEKAIEFAQKAKGLAEEYEDITEIAQSLYMLGEISARKGNLAESVVYLEKALSLSEQLGDKPTIARCLNNLGVSKQRMGEFAQGKAYFERAKSLYEELGNQHGLGLVMNYLGYAAITQQDRHNAKAHWLISLDILKQVGDLRSCGIVLGNLGSVFFDLTQYDEAIYYYEQSLKIARDVGNRYGENIQIENLGRVYCSAGNYEKGMAYLEEALAIRRHNSDRISIAYALNNIGIFASHAGEYERARIALEECLDHANETGEKTILLLALNNLGFVYALQDDAPRAQNYFVESLTKGLAIQYLLAIQISVLGMAWIYLHQQNPLKACELIGLIQSQPNQIGYFDMRISEIMPHLQHTLSSDELMASVEKGELLDIHAVAKQLLDDFVIK